MSLATPYTQGKVPAWTSTKLPVLILKPQTQVLELSHEVLQFLAKSCCYGCARSLTGRASLTSLWHTDIALHDMAYVITDNMMSLQHCTSEPRDMDENIALLIFKHVTVAVPRYA